MKDFLKKASFFASVLASTVLTLASCGNVALTGSDSGSPLEDRSGGLVMSFIIILVVLIGGAALVFLVVRKQQAYKNSPEYLEKQKNRPTTAGDIAEVAREAELSKSETALLKKICARKRSPNITFLVKEVEEIEKEIKVEFEALNVAGDEDGKASAFSLRRKIIKTYKPQIIIKNTKPLESDTVFTYTVTKGYHHKFVLKQNNPDDMVLTVPKSAEEMNEIPKPLSKITMIFEDKDNSPYEVNLRVVRFQDGKGGKEMIASHTDNVTPLRKRNSERIELNATCKFSPVKVTKNEKGDPVKFDVGEKEHEGILEDVSIGGARVTTNLPIKAGQYVHIKGKMGGENEESATGIIVRTTKRKENDFVLHVKFLKIDIATVNRIQAVACGWTA